LLRFQSAFQDNNDAYSICEALGTNELRKG